MSDKRAIADEVLSRKDLSQDQKLFVISQLYRKELNSGYPQLWYALLGWKDAHLSDANLRSGAVIDYLERFQDMERGRQDV